MLKQESLHASAKLALFSFSPLVFLHLSQECLFHREMHFLCLVCDGCDIFSGNEYFPCSIFRFLGPKRRK